MSTPARLGAFAAVLVAVLLGGLGLGRAVGPVAGDAVARHGAEDAGHGVDPADGEHGASAEGGHAASGSVLSGLSVALDGYVLRPGATTLQAGTSTFRFLVEGPDGRPVVAYDQTHERELHLVVVRRDGEGFQHLHPQRRTDGTWETPLTLGPGAHRAYADFAPAGEAARTLAVDLLVPGPLEPQPWPDPATTAAFDGPADGLEVRLDGGLRPGEESELAFTVTRGGAPVDLEPYLGARGHLVALREGDLGYLHVHADGDALSFAATAPTAGRYRLYLQVQVDGVVRTADLTALAEDHAHEDAAHEEDSA
jgi:hypothetical protein